MAEENYNIEIFGQKFSYPTTWQGTAAVVFVCIALTAIAYIARGWATPEILNGLAGLNTTTKQQEGINNSLLDEINKLSEKVDSLGLNVSKDVGDAESGQQTEAEIDTLRLKASKREFQISRLREEIAEQSLARLQAVAPIVQPKSVIKQQVEQQEQVQLQQQQIQEELQEKW